MGIKKCQIFFDNVSKRYYAGQTVSGRVNYTIDSDKEVHGIKINCKGKAVVKWSEISHQRRPGKSRTTFYFTGLEEYFEMEYYLIGANTLDKITIPSGAHVYPFEFYLPSTLPSSFNGAHGYVKYYVKVILDRPGKLYQETKAAFTVLSTLDLNRMPLLKNPIRQETVETFCCCCCVSGSMSIVVTVSCGGFVPGQSINITFDVENSSGVSIEELIFELRQITSFHADNPDHQTKTDKSVVAKFKYSNQFRPGESHTSTNDLNVPALLASSHLMNCSIIDVEYELKISAITSGCSCNVVFKIPITIGTVPFTQLFTPPTAPVLSHFTENINQPITQAPINPEVMQRNVPHPSNQMNMPLPYPTPGVSSDCPPYPSDPTVIQSSTPPPTYEETVIWN